MPRFDFNPATVSAGGIEVFPKGDYEFVIGEPKAFSRTNAAGNPSFGLRVALTFADGEYAGKRTIYSMYFQSEGSQSMAKQFLMAGLGFKRNDEKAFNEEMLGEDFSCDFEAGHVGDAWMKLKGQRIKGSLDVQANQQNGDQQQAFKGWQPFNA